MTTPLSLTLLVLGLVLVAVVLVDVPLTIMATSTTGPLTRSWSQPVWRGLLAIHRRRPIHGALALTGPLVVLASIVLWYVLLVVGVALVFLAFPGSVVSSTTGAPAPAGQVVYFLPTTASSLGYGDLVPDGSPWTTVATTTTLVATVILTISLSYVIAVLSAAVKRRTMASAVRALGDAPVPFVRNAVLGRRDPAVHAYLTTLAGDVSATAEQQRSYPVLRFFHSSRRSAAAAPAVLLLGDASFLASQVEEEYRPSAGVRSIVEAALREFGDAKQTKDHPHADDGAAAGLRNQASELGIDPAGRDGFEADLAAYLPVRALLVAACVDDGWAPGDD